MLNGFTSSSVRVPLTSAPVSNGSQRQHLNVSQKNLLTINWLDVGDIFPEFPLQVLVIEVLWRRVALRTGLVIILLDVHRLLLNIELLVESLLARHKLQNGTFYHDVYVVQIVAGFPRNPFSRRDNLLKLREKHFNERSSTSFEHKSSVYLCKPSFVCSTFLHIFYIFREVLELFPRGPEHHDSRARHRTVYFAIKHIKTLSKSSHIFSPQKIT